MSGTYSSGYQLDDILTESWERIGKSPAILTGDVVTSARRSLNLILLDWTNRGVPLWQVSTVTAPLLMGIGDYTMPSYVVDILDVYVKVGINDRILGRISRANYAGISDKTLEGPPTQMWVNRQVPAIQLLFYPVPDYAYQMTANVLVQPQDVTSLFQRAAAPVLWSEALASALAARMAEKFAPERFAEKMALAEKAWGAASAEDRERVPMTIQPDFSAFR